MAIKFGYKEMELDLEESDCEQCNIVVELLFVLDHRYNKSSVGEK